jgi:1,4-dihydroxy-2-naphthoyl-CoA synthase
LTGYEDITYEVEEAGLSNLAMSTLKIFVQTDEGKEGARGFAEKRPADFARYVTA